MKEISTLGGANYYKNVYQKKDLPKKSSFDTKGVSSYIDDIDIGSDGKKSQKDVSIKNEAIKYLEEIQGKLTNNGKPKSENEYIYGNILTKVSELLKRHDIQKLNINQEFAKVTDVVIGHTRGEVTQLKDSFNPADPTNYMYGLINFAASIGFELIPESAEAEDFGLKPKQEKSNGVAGTVALGVGAGTILYLVKKGKIKEATAKLKELAKQGHIKLTKIIPEPLRNEVGAVGHGVEDLVKAKKVGGRTARVETSSKSFDRHNGIKTRIMDNVNKNYLDNLSAKEYEIFHNKVYKEAEELFPNGGIEKREYIRNKLNSFAKKSKKLSEIKTIDLTDIEIENRIFSYVMKLRKGVCKIGERRPEIKDFNLKYFSNEEINVFLKEIKEGKISEHKKIKIRDILLVEKIENNINTTLIKENADLYNLYLYGKSMNYSYKLAEGVGQYFAFSFKGKDYIIKPNDTFEQFFTRTESRIF